MKILCLHGHGTGSEIMEYQMLAMMKEADPSWEFYHLAGEFQCPPAPDVASIFPGPYLCYTRAFSPEGVAAAHSLLEETIDEHGPFEGVFGFSQGASIALSYLIEASISGEESPFRFAVLCSSPLPFGSTSGWTSLSSEQHLVLRSGDDGQISSLDQKSRIVASAITETVDSVEAITKCGRSFYLDRPLHEIPWALHPATCSSRLAIPTVHVRGKNEPSGIRKISQVLESFCDPEIRKSLEHSGGHHIPRLPSEVRQMVSAMEWAAEQSQLMGPL